ncbi:hypothetical protein NPIL_1681 [Nephila pilipes]|uniref:Uncharacterized protein n=1 Tax=Nephila pilipes TaxID=299642 RepID=A0A8X6UK16_NEPPI|nr:hypothetical protein NPIL_1681 [Nephila pilipes]
MRWRYLLYLNGEFKSPNDNSIGCYMYYPQYAWSATVLVDRDERLSEGGKCACHFRCCLAEIRFAGRYLVLSLVEQREKGLNNAAEMTLRDGLMERPANRDFFYHRHAYAIGFMLYCGMVLIITELIGIIL